MTDASMLEDKLERLRAAVQTGLDELERGEGEIVTWDELARWLLERGRELDK